MRSSSHWPGLAWRGCGGETEKGCVYLSCATLEAEGQGSQEGWCEGLYLQLCEPGF